MSTKFNVSLIGAIVFTYALHFNTFAQTEAAPFTAKNTIFVEFGGTTGNYAVHYGYLFHQKGSFKMSASVGFFMVPEKKFSSTFWNPVLPLEITALYGKSKHHLEVGTGITPYLRGIYGLTPMSLDIIKISNKLVAVVPLRLGYRYQKPDGGLFFRVGYTTLIGNFDGNIVFDPISPGISLGKSF